MGDESNLIPVIETLAERASKERSPEDALLLAQAAHSLAQAYGAVQMTKAQIEQMQKFQ